MTAPSALPPDVLPPRKPPDPGRRLLGVLLGFAIEFALCWLSAVTLPLFGKQEYVLFFGIAQFVPAIPIAIVCWRKDMKGTAISLAFSSALVLLLVGGAGVLFWVTCAQGGSGH